MVYTITCVKAETQVDYAYVGAYQEFIAPNTGIYQFECWGGIGGKSRCNGSLGSLYGKGGYAKGEITVKKGEKYYVYVGKNGTDAVVKKDSAAAWNGGGLGTWDHADDEASGGGGGATDIRLVSGNWNETESLASRIMVAGGAGGTAWRNISGGNGGGISGGDTRAKGATQTSGYQFGIGQNGSGGGKGSNGIAGRWRRLLGWNMGRRF